MPTGAKLIAAIFFGFLAYFISDLIKPLLIETHGSKLTPFSWWNGFIGVLMIDWFFWTNRLAPQWWMGLRIPLSGLVCACLLVPVLL